MTMRLVLKGSESSGWYGPPKGTHIGGSGSVDTVTHTGNRVEGDVIFGHDKIVRSAYGSTKGQQLSREIEVRKGMQIIVYIKQGLKTTPFKLVSLRDAVLSTHETLSQAKKAAKTIADSVHYESDVPGLED